MRALLRPGWILATLVVVCFSVACYTVLAPWQLDSAATVQHRQELIERGAGTPPVPVDQLQAPGAPWNADHEWREVAITGRYLNDHQIVLRHRSPDQARATQVVTPFQLADSDQIVLVNRGSVPTESEVTTAPTGQIAIGGRLRAPESTNPYKEPKRDDGRLVAYAIDASRLGAETGLRPAPFYLRLAAGQPGSLGEVPIPPTIAGPPHTSYGIQWLALGALAPIVLVFFAVRSVRETIA